MSIALSPGDEIALTALALSATAFLTHLGVNWVRKARGVLARDISGRLSVDGLEVSLKALANSQKELSDRYRDHEIECSEFRGTMAEAAKNHATSAEKGARALEQLQAQMRFVGAGANDRFMEVKS